MLWVRLLVLCAVLAAHASWGARILGIFPMPAPSHQNILTALTKGLAKKGHDVTVVTPLPRSPPGKYREIVIGNSMEKVFGATKVNFFDKFSHMTSIEMNLMLWALTTSICEFTLEQPQVQELLHSNETFDLILISAFSNECLLGFSHTFQAPVIQISVIGAMESAGDAMGNPSPYAYAPDFTLGYTDRMTFIERLHNTALSVFKTLGRHLYFLPKQNSLIQKYFNNTGPGPVPHLNELHTSLMLLNNHFSINYPRPYLPNVIEVGGMHIEPPQPLPKDLKQFLDEAKEGVIYFSMGSNLRSADLKPEQREALLKAFGKLSQKVLWKWEDDSLPGLPANVRLGKWFPQADLLAHPNLRVFVTHGGLLSTQEALYHGVPLVGIPVLGDQHLNMQRAVNTGYAVKLSLNQLSDQAVKAAIQEVLTNPKYRERAGRLSRVFRDQPRTPLETAVFWAEYVIRHRGAGHMRSAALHLCWFQYHLLDVVSALLAGGLTLLALFYLGLRAVCRCLLPSRTPTPTPAPAPAHNTSKKKN